jgi:hypothetical protein
MTEESLTSPLPGIPWTAVPVKTPGLVTRTIVDETVVVPIRGRLAQLQNLYILTPVGSHLWSEIDGAKDLRALHDSVLENYDVGADEARADLIEFIRNMREAGLLGFSSSGDEVLAR